MLCRWQLSALKTEAHSKLEIRMSDGCIVTARNFIIAHVMLSDSFDPSDATDLQYLWDLCLE